MATIPAPMARRGGKGARRPRPDCATPAEPAPCGRLRPRRGLRAEGAEFSFRLVGRSEATAFSGPGGFFELRAPLWTTASRSALDAQQFQGEVAGWLAEHATGEWHVRRLKDALGHAPMQGRFAAGGALGVLIQRAADLVAFEAAFSVLRADGPTLDAVLAG